MMLQIFLQNLDKKNKPFPAELEKSTVLAQTFSLICLLVLSKLLYLISVKIIFIISRTVQVSLFRCNLEVRRRHHICNS